MRACPACLSCFRKQALKTARIVTNDEEQVRQIVRRVESYIATVSLDTSPPHIGREVYDLISQITETQDPFVEIKRRSTEQGLALYPRLKEIVHSSKDRIRTATRLAIAGNAIDFGSNIEFDLHREIEDALVQDLAIDHSDDFLKALESARDVLYLADNAGETVFDRFLIEELGKPVTYAVRSAPIINDATRRDAALAGIGRIATLITSGSRIPGTPLSQCSLRFRRAFRNADLIISKGQGNYETLDEEKAPLFFLLKAKCAVIARHFRIRKGSILLVKGRTC